MPLIFPSTPTLGQTYASGSSAVYQWNGSYWETVAPKLLVSASYALTASYLLTSSLGIVWPDVNHSGHQWGINFAYKNKIFAVGSNFSYRTTGFASDRDQSGLLYEILVLQRPVSFSKLVVNANNIHALGDNGVVYSYGVNSYGQLGNGNTTNVFGRDMQPITASSISGSGKQVLDIYGANNWISGHSNDNIATIMFKVNDNGTLKYYGVGRNVYANLGIGNTLDARSVPQENVVMRGKNIVSMSIGSPDGSSVLALVDDGTVWSWGYNNVGQLGTGNNTLGTNPTQAKSGSGLVPITGAKEVVSCYMTDEGSLNWYNTYILKQDGTVLAAGNGAAFLRGDGQDSTSPFFFSDVRTSATTKLQNIVKLYCKGWQRAALDSSGNLWAWGRNYYQHWGDGSPNAGASPYAKIIATGVEDVNIDIATSRVARMLIKRGGVWYCSGYNAGYSLLIGHRNGDEVNIRKEMVLPAGKIIKQWIPIGNYSGNDIAATMFQTTDNDIYIGGFVEFILGAATGYIAAPVKINWDIN